MFFARIRQRSKQFENPRRRAPIVRIHNVRVVELITRNGRVASAPQDGGDDEQTFENAECYIGPGNRNQGLRGLTIGPDGHIRC